MASYNEITGSCLITKPATDTYRKGWDGIDWGTKAKTEDVKAEQTEVKAEDKPESK
jgi:hypothetical protein